MSIRDPKWKYHDAAESRKTGYLERKFARIRAEQSVKAAQPKATVQPLRKAKG